jgi:squalene-hopene/tetraprenyl-beta-curcumene cyclase
MTDSRLQLGDLLDPRLHARTLKVQAAYVAHVTDLGIPALRALVAGHMVTLYHCLPWMFSDAVGGFTEDQHEELAVSGLLYFGHLLLVDRMIDHDDEFSAGTLLAANALHERSLVVLAGAGMLNGASSKALRDYTRAYEGAIVREPQAVHDDAFGWSDYCAVAMGKAALLKASPALMALNGGREDLKSTLDEMVDSFNLSAQIHDDIKDWRKDVANGRPSMVYGVASLAKASRSDVSALIAKSDEPLANWLFYDGHAERALTEAANAAARSALLANDIGAARWAKASNYFAERLSKLNDRLSETRRRLTSRAATDPRHASDQAMRLAVTWITGQMADAQEPFAHRMVFAPEHGFGGSTPHQVGAVFPRAVAGWSFNVARAGGADISQAAVDANLRAIWDARRAGEPGGWSYFPGLPELPPDADDLGQVALAGGSVRDPQRDEALIAARDLLIGEHLRADGAIGTWLTDSRSDQATQDRYGAAIELHWGRAYDAEVTANVVFGFAAIGLPFPADVVGRACEWVRSQQQADGSWASTWYVGPYYGTYLCSRLLASAAGFTESCARGSSFLRAKQRRDGGWGEGESDSLSTALAILGLTECGDDRADDALRRGIKYLAMTQGSSGEWRGVPLIQMDLARASGGKPRMLFHGSSLLTTSYALAAIARARGV